ncbi:MAG: WbuC family cupin fold metalloprotein [Sulfurisoma sp.]|nr:WbuC family cupin fold metalloprotein [Sulfurisoma sp.]
MIRLIDTALLDEVSAEARAAPRGRRNRNFHPRDDYPGHRLLNAIEPGSYIAPHRHLDPTKDETMVVLRGALGLVVFDDAGCVVQTQKVGAGGTAIAGTAANMDTARGVVGIDIAHGIWHTVFALESGTVFLEAKSGPYLPLTAAECAPWAPAENAAAAPDYLTGLRRLFP